MDILYISKRYLVNYIFYSSNRLVIYCSILGTSLGISILILILSLSNGLENEFKNNILRFIPHIFTNNNIKKTDYNNFQENSSIMKNIKKITPLVMFNVILHNNKGIEKVYMIGIDDKDYEPILDYLIKKKKK